MTEAEWWGCESPGTRLSSGPQVSARKRRLFAAGCCHHVWGLLSDERSRTAVEVAERFADDEATEDELTIAHRAACDAEEELLFGNQPAWRGEEDAEDLDILDAARAASAASALNDCTALASDCACDAGGRPVREAQLKLLLEIIGNPFRPVALDPAWRTPAVLTLAQAAYENRVLPAGTLEPDRLAVLADALEEAGYDQAELLGHLRSNGPHTRGCWAVDLLLAQE